MSEAYSKKMEKHGDIQVLVILAKAFLNGEGRNQNFIRSLEALFNETVGLHFSIEFEELEEAFAMYGASSQDYDDKIMVKALKKIIPVLEGQF